MAAAGQAKLTGRLAVCAGTTGPGSTHLVAGLYEAARDHAPVLALSGEMPRRLKGIDYHQSTEPDLLFRDVSLYTQTIVDPAQAPSVIHQAVSSAYAGPGVAHLTLPQDVLASRIEHANLVDDSAPAAIRTSGVTSTSAPGSLRCRMTVGFPGPLPSSTARDLAANISRIGFGGEAIGQLVDKYDIRDRAMHTQWKDFLIGRRIVPVVGLLPAWELYQHDRTRPSAFHDGHRAHRKPLAAIGRHRCLDLIQIIEGGKVRHIARNTKVIDEVVFMTVAP